MKSLKINSSCQDSIERTDTNSSFSASVLVGQLENQTYLLVDVLPLYFPQPTNDDAKSFDAYLNKPNEQEETPLNRFLNMTSNAKMMLVGGLSVVGVLFSVQFADFENNSHTFKSMVDTIKDISGSKTETVIIVQNNLKKKQEYLLYDFNQRKFSPIDTQFQSFKDRVFKLSTTLEAELTISINKNQAGVQVSDISEMFKQPLRRWATDLSHGTVKVGGMFFDKTETLDNIKSKLQVKEGALECEIFSSLPVHKVYAKSEEEVSTVLTFKGVFTASNYVLAKKVTLKDAYQALVMDIIQSVQDKLNLFVNENEEILGQELSQNKVFFLPNRVYFEFVEKTNNLFTYCDYLTSEETLDDSEQRLKDWFKLTSKYLNTTELTNAQSFRKKYNEYQEKNKVKQHEGVTQRKTEKKEQPDKKENDSKIKEPSSNVKEDNTIKYAALVGVVVALVMLRLFVL